MVKETRGGRRSSKIPTGMSKEVYESYKKDGLSDTDIKGVWEQTLAMRKQMQMNKERREKQGAREITSSTYEASKKRTKKAVDSWFGNR